MQMGFKSKWPAEMERPLTITVLQVGSKTKKSKNEKNELTTELHQELKQKGVIRQAKMQALVSKLLDIKSTFLLKKQKLFQAALVNLP